MQFRYEAGDVLAIHPENDSNLVDEFIHFLRLDPNQVLRITLNQEIHRKIPSNVTIRYLSQLAKQHARLSPFFI